MSLPTPNTRKEQYLNAIATGNAGGLPTPITREEEYLDAIAKSGGGSGDGDMKKSVYDSDLAVSEAGGIGAFVSDAVSGKVDKVTGKGLSENDYTDSDKAIVGGVTDALAGKVDKVEGKGLSTNDYDDTEKEQNATNTSAIEAIASQLGKAKIYLAGSYEAASVTFTGIKIIGSRYPALLIGNGNGTPFMAACALHSAGVSDVAISDANLTIATSNVTDTQYDLTIGGVNTWGQYALMVFYR